MKNLIEMLDSRQLRVAMLTSRNSCCCHYVSGNRRPYAGSTAPTERHLGALVGLALGRLQQGIIIGATLS
ncbi:MAG: hypothetical protein ACLR17_10350 [Enterobacteriaceae bacterium]